MVVHSGVSVSRHNWGSRPSGWIVGVGPARGALEPRVAGAIPSSQHTLRIKHPQSLVASRSECLERSVLLNTGVQSQPFCGECAARPAIHGSSMHDSARRDLLEDPDPGCIKRALLYPDHAVGHQPGLVVAVGGTAVDQPWVHEQHVPSGANNPRRRGGEGAN